MISLSHAMLIVESTNFFRELVEKNPVPQTYLLLGDAYMSIQEVQTT